MSTVTQAETLLPCPFCGWADLATMEVRKTFYVVCDGCGARVIHPESLEDAVINWDTRTSSQVELLEALEEARTCLLDGDDIFPDRACRDDTILGILNTAISNARSNSMVSGRVGE